MKNRITRNRYVIGLIVVVFLAMESGTRAYSRADNSQHIDLISYHWGINSSQMLKICIGNLEGTTQSSDRPTETLSLYFVKIQSDAGYGVWEVNLSVPPLGEFRCVDISYDELVRAGLVPEPTSRIQFLVSITGRSSQDETETVGSNQTITVGAVQTINVGTGNTVLYQAFKKSSVTATSGDSPD
jgi:hypothetical protein